MSEKVLQEFYCRHCPADDPQSDDPERRRRGGHFRVKLSLGYDAAIEIHCPNCRAVHQRVVYGGVIGDGHKGGFREVIKVGKSAWSRLPLSALQASARRERPYDDFQTPLRGGAVIATAADRDSPAQEDEDPGLQNVRDNFLRERWLEKAGSERGES